MNAYRATELLLKNYRNYKAAIDIGNENATEFTRYAIKMVDSALEVLKDDKHIEVIKLMYIEGKTAEETSFILYYDITTVFRHKKRLINKLKVILFPDVCMREFLGDICESYTCVKESEAGHEGTNGRRKGTDPEQ